MHCCFKKRGYGSARAPQSRAVPQPQANWASPVCRCGYLLEPYAKCEMGSDMTAPPDSSALPMRLACVAFAHSSVIVRGVEPGRGDHGVGRRQRSTNKQTNKADIQGALEEKVRQRGLQQLLRREFPNRHSH